MKDDTKEMLSYVFVGGMTTLVNYVVYFILLKRVLTFLVVCAASASKVVPRTG